MREFSGVISEYERGSGKGGMYLSEIPGGYLVGQSSSTLAKARVKIGDKYLLKLQVVEGLDSHIRTAHATGEPCTLYIHRRRLIGIKLGSGELYFIRKRVVVGLLAMALLTGSLLLIPFWFWLIAFPVTILLGIFYWAIIWEYVYYFDGRRLKKIGGIPLSMYGERLDVRSAI